MNEDRVVQVLEEIRELQRQQLANQERAIGNQRRGIRMLPLVLLLVFLMAYLPWLWRWAVYLISR
jgi:hypothetical protein